MRKRERLVVRSHRRHQQAAIREDRGCEKQREGEKSRVARKRRRKKRRRDGEEEEAEEGWGAGG
eukprot:768567-Hanusia_phi.AAC.5